MSRFIRGLRSATDNFGHPIQRYAIRDTGAVANGPDVQLFGSEQERDAALARYEAEPEWFRGELNSPEHGGTWGNPPVWEEPAADPTDTVTGAQHAAVVAELNATIERLTAQLAAAHAPISDVTDDRLMPIWDAAALAAQDEGFCSEYDRLANRLGIPGRERLYRGTVSVTFNVYSYATARGAEDAQEAMEQQVRDALDNLPISHYGGFEDGSISHLDIDEVSTDDVDIY